MSLLRTRRWLALALIAGAVLVADQASKFAAVNSLTTLFADSPEAGIAAKARAFVREKDLWERGLATQPKDVLRSVWQWRYVQNRGAAFDFLARADKKVRVPFFLILPIAASIFVLVYFRRTQDHELRTRVALALLLGGALGNGLDRVLHGYVIDFIAWHWFDPTWANPARHWPTFNVADCGVSIGIALLLLDAVLPKTRTLDSADPAANARAA
ncbi:MAG: signal peptidase II [Deltaproteobacteria bacterium]|nr:signal peptidase II [Deltaproteobacteria bacterium]